MSAIRRNSNRAEARNKRSSPYARALLRPVYRLFGWRYEDNVGESSSPSQGGPNAPNLQATESGSSSQQSNDNDTLQQHFPSSNRVPLTPVKSSNFPSLAPPEHTSASIPDAELVASYFSQRVGTNISANFVESMVTDMQITPETQRFRFTFTTPSRESSPLSVPNGNLANAAPSSSPRRKLSRNPNGTYRWEGAGSAKHARPRNRYASPAFGVSPSKPERLVMKESTTAGEMSTPDSKRRKIGEDGPTGALPESAKITSLPFPVTVSPTTPRTNGVNKSSHLPASSRLRTPAKPTAPVVPSPLRQAWSDASSSGSRDDSRKSPSQQTKQSKTANFMAELIKETSPPNKPDLSNPYQSASPVGKVGPPRRATKRPRATGRPAAPTKEQELEEGKRKADEEKHKETEKLKEYSPQAIIEATVPKGSKRSRPPAHFEKSLSTSRESSSRSSPPSQREAPVVIETRKVTYVIEEVDDDEESKRSAKRSKPSIGGRGFPSSLPKKTSSSPPNSDITIEEVGDVVMQGSEKGKEQEKQNGVPKLSMPANGSVAPPAIGAPSPTSRSSFTGFKANSIPKEPSKLRFSFQPEGTSSTPSSPAPAPSPFPAPSPPSLQNLSSGFNFSFKPANAPAEEVKPKESKKSKAAPNLDVVRSKVLAIDIAALPVFVFTSSATSVLPSNPGHVKARNAVKALAASSLPQFEFEIATSATPFSFNFDPSKPKPAPSYTPKKARSPKSNPYLMSSGVAAPGAASLLNFGSSASKAPPASSNVAPVTAFDFAAAGMKPPTVDKDKWTCSSCLVPNPTSALKCVACEEPAPGNAPTSSARKAPAPTPPLPPAVPVKAFDFAAAGMKPPTVSKATWKCGLCAIVNADSASDCQACGTSK